MNNTIFKKVTVIIVLAGIILAGGCAGYKGGGAAPPVPDTKENVHVYIAFGQSNMQGPAAVEEQDTEGVPERFRVLNVIPDTYAGEYRESGKWYRAVPPLVIPDKNKINWKGLPTGLSPADYFGRTLAENTAGNITIGIIAVASGDLALATFDKTRALEYYNGSASKTAKDGMDRYGKDMYGSIIRAAQIAMETGTIKGIIVHQGETGTGLPSVRWGELLKTIYNNMLFDLGLEPNSIPILAGKTFNAGEGRTEGDLDDAVIRNYLPRAHVIDSSGCAGRLEPDGRTIDNIHFGSDGIRELGRRYARKMLELNYQK